MKGKYPRNNNQIQQTLNECIVLAKEYGLSKLSMKQITTEVKAARENKKISSKK